MRMQLVPLPAMKPRQPSSRHILANALPIDILYSVRPWLWTWKRIFKRSSGETTVLETAPATPPAMNEAVIGCETSSRKRSMRGECVGVDMIAGVWCGGAARSAGKREVGAARLTLVGSDVAERFDICGSVAGSAAGYRGLRAARRAGLGLRILGCRNAGEQQESCYRWTGRGCGVGEKRIIKDARDGAVEKRERREEARREEQDRRINECAGPVGRGCGELAP